MKRTFVVLLVVLAACSSNPAASAPDPTESARRITLLSPTLLGTATTPDPADVAQLECPTKADQRDSDYLAAIQKGQGLDADTVLRRFVVTALARCSDGDYDRAAERIASATSTDRAAVDALFDQGKAILAG